MGNGICSITHLSKIERGMTMYSPDILDLLSERLGIQLNVEIERYKQTKLQLDKWYESLVMQDKRNIFRLKKIIENEGIINTPDHYYNYKLLLARFHLFLHDNEKG